MKVVNKTKYKDKPSIPKFKWKIFRLLNSDTNWNWVMLESNWYHIISEIKKLRREVNKEINLKAKALKGKNIISIEPIIGIIKIKVIIFYFVFFFY